MTLLRRSKHRSSFEIDTMNIRSKIINCICAMGMILAAQTVTAFAGVESKEWIPVSEVLQAGVDYASEQWAFRNDGSIELIAHSDSGKRHIAARTGLDIEMHPAWELYKSKQHKRDIIVAVIDTGVNIFHPDLVNSMWINDDIPGNGLDDDGNGYVDDVYGWDFYDDDAWPFSGTADDNHGTHAAGTIAASHNGTGVNGVNDGNHVKIMSIRALGTENGTGKISGVIKAIKYAEANGASICNLSFGTRTYSQNLYEAMRDSKMLFVVAAGNGDAKGRGVNIDSNPIYPASFDLDNILSVASAQMDGELDPSSDYGVVSVDVAAPGSYILSTIADGNYGFMSGTSMAAPFVSGAAALVASYKPSLSMLQVKNILMQTVVPHMSMNGKLTSGGMINASRALTMAEQF